MRQAPEQDVAATFALIAMGGNVATPAGSPEITVLSAIAEVGQEIGLTIKQAVVASRLYHTPCFPAGAGPDYVNAAMRVETALDARAILAALHEVETRHGRERVQRWGMRTLDLDLLALGDQILPDRATYDSWAALPPDLQRMRAPGELILPHPRMQDRAFVLVPLADVAPDWVHPVLGLSVTELLARRPAAERAEVVAI